VRGSTFDNAANLAASALAELKLRYENTRLGRQELYGEILDDVEGALWTRKMIDEARVTEAPPLVRIVVAIDPAVTSNTTSDETGIVAAGIDHTGNYYVLDDKTLRSTPDAWARTAVNLYHELNADKIIAETNNGGDMVVMVLKQIDVSVPVKKVTATRGKQLRAEPISALYEQGRVHHVGYFEDLENQMCEWTPLSNESPDRLDALVWACGVG
jgi:phage terminase large subunit-like protein